MRTSQPSIGMETSDRADKPARQAESSNRAQASGTDKSKRTDRVLPASTFDGARLSLIDADVRLQAKRVKGVATPLENFDGVGQWRDQDSGYPIDSKGQLVDGTKLEGVSSLRAALASRPEAVVGTMTQKLLMYAVGREFKYYDMPTVRSIMRNASRDRYRFSALVLGIVQSAPFQMRVKEEAATKVAAVKGRSDQ